MKMSNSEYLAYLKRKDPKSPIVKDTVLAFVVGGAICLVGQVLVGLFRNADLSDDHAKMAVSMVLVLASAVLTALGWYDRLAKHAGAGTLVPITGFANAVVAPAMEFKSEGLVLGMSARLFIVAGPVIVYGVSASVLYGVALLLFA